MQSIEIASVVVTIHALEVIRRCASRKPDISQTGKHVLDERQRRHEPWIILHGRRRKAGIEQRPDLRIVLLPPNSRLRIFDILDRREDGTFEQTPNRPTSRPAY